MSLINPIAILPVRGGSKEIKDKNLLEVNKKSLMEISVNQVRKSIDIPIYISADSETILKEGRKLGCIAVKRPLEIANDKSPSEEAIQHTVEYIEKEKKQNFNTIIFLQATSPLRKREDFISALDKYKSEQLDSLFSANDATDYLLWKQESGEMKSINFDNENRLMRQEKVTSVIENGSFYIFDKELYKKYNQRLFGKISYYLMEAWQLFEVDTLDDYELCKKISKLMKVYGIYD